MLTWWMWMVLGLVLAALELATPGGIFIIFFGVAAVAVGVLDLAGLATRDSVQWLLFSVIALVALRLFRRPILKRIEGRDAGGDIDSLVGEVGIASTGMAPQEHGRLELRGTTWSARNVDATPIAAGQRCQVVTVRGLVLDVRLD
jgi:membrane protein implicated in regulation of membrane protease activity